VAGTYSVDFYMWFNSTGNPQYVNFEFINGQPTSVVVDANTSTYQEYRVRGTFVNNLDFSNFPFDNHNLTIEIESKNLQANQLTFKPDTANSGTDSSLNLVGWTLLSSSIQAANHSYSGNQSFSRLTFTFDIGRPSVQAFMKDVFPIILITAIAMMAFFLPPTRSFERILIGVTTLLAAVQFNSSLLSQVPPLDYLTIADKMMITVYALFLYGIAVTILLAKLVDIKDFERASRLNKKGAVLVPVIAAIFLGLLLLVGY
ncbi:MAG: hypothetical protein OK454_07975, partial [Thaumarchaeota archaeon]|nr:hypothetical protein [Nitrososphaerota archaeon]